MLIEFTRMHRQWMPGEVADLGAGIADALVKSRRAIYAKSAVRSEQPDEQPDIATKKTRRRKKAIEQG